MGNWFVGDPHLGPLTCRVIGTNLGKAKNLGTTPCPRAKVVSEKQHRLPWGIPEISADFKNVRNAEVMVAL